MKSLFQEFRSKINAEELTGRVKELCKIELGQTFPCFHRSIDTICKWMKEAGLPNVERLNYPADGKTTYEDKRMPIAWDATIGKLTLCDEKQTVAADFTKHPFHLINGSTATKPGGEIVRIITEQQFLAGEDPRNALVILEPETWPRAKVLTPILDMGGRGIISDFMMGRYDFPDAIQWVVACTEGDHWHIQCEDRDFIGFSVNLRMGSKIRELAKNGPLKARIECDGHRYEGELPAATALIPGRRKEEIWLFAHTFEPMLNDDAVGVVSGIEIAKQIMAQGIPEYSLRLIFAMELYGFAAFHAHFKGKAIGGINIDTLPSNQSQECLLVPPIASVPFHGVEILKQMAQEFKDILPCRLSTPACYDDICLSDSTIGIPSVWFLESTDSSKGGIPLWHSSAQNADDFIDPQILADNTAFAAVWVYQVLHYTGAPATLPKLELNPVSSPWRDLAAQQVYARAEKGLPHDLIRVPKAQRRSMPDGVIYGPMGSLLSGMDGKKDLAQIILETEADRQVTLTDAQIKKYMDAINYLADWGYLKIIRRTALTRVMLKEALEELGVSKDDVLLVHSSVSKCGYVEGGAETWIRGVMDAIGENGTALFPTFTYPYAAFEGNVNKTWMYRPYDPTDPSQVWTGTVPRTLLTNFPEAIRSRHITHSWAGLGAKAKMCLEAQGPLDPPASETSPIAKALELGGKVLYLGSGLAPSTFLHFLETVNHAPFLQPAVCKVKEPDGSFCTVLIEQHLPGHRDFYRSDAENCKFFQRAVKAGLKITEVPFGMGKLQLIDLKNFYEVGMRLWKEDPRILLCDDPDCSFCSRFSTFEK